MDELGTFLAAIIANGGTLGTISWGTTALIIKLVWEGNVSNEKKRWLSLGVPVAWVAIGYFGGVLYGSWPFAANSLFQALQVLAAEIAGALTLFTATKSVEKAKEATP